jgi:aspartate-semialdehyde dehydrogenase
VIRTPVFHGYAVSLFAKLNDDAEEDEVRTDLGRNGIHVAEEVFSPVEAVGSDDFHVSRIRQEPGQPGCFWFWIVGDNLKGAVARNAVMTAESIISRIS